MKKKLAIVGTGISGMSAAYFLKDHFEITVFEKNDYVGGHTNTIEVENSPVDTGFIVFNLQTYPNLVKLFNRLGVEYVDSDMSFSVVDQESNFEYCGSGLNGLFGQRKNIFNLKFLKMLYEVNDFNTNCLEVLNSEIFASMTIKEYLEYKNYGQDMINKYLIPCSSAIWSTPPSKMFHFPIQTLVRFFKNHGLLGLNTHFSWKTVLGGSREYKKKLISQFENLISINEKVISVVSEGEFQKLVTDKGEYLFDKIVFASHGDQTFEIIKDKTAVEAEVLSMFKYEDNQAIVHTDTNLMPTNKRNWSSWNYYIASSKDDRSITTYYMNRLQPLKHQYDIFVSLNAKDLIDPSKIIKVIDYEHPLFDFGAINGQKRFSELNNQNNGRHFCGAYFRYGFHEDGIWSALEMYKHIIGSEFNL